MYRLSPLAINDIDSILDFPEEAFGRKTTRRYYESLLGCFTMLGENPNLGRSVHELAEGLRRFEHQSHIVFYEPQETNILIVRVLHKRMDPPQHLED